MIQLVSKDLSKATAKALDDLQKLVNKEHSFKAKKDKGKKLWKSKRSSPIFEEVENTLRDMCVSVGVCNCCEQSEAGDIEHIYPKSFFQKRYSFGRIIY